MRKNFLTADCADRADKRRMGAFLFLSRFLNFFIRVIRVIRGQFSFCT